MNKLFLKIFLLVLCLSTISCEDKKNTFTIVFRLEGNSTGIVSDITVRGENTSFSVSSLPWEYEVAVFQEIDDLTMEREGVDVEFCVDRNPVNGQTLEVSILRNSTVASTAVIKDAVDHTCIRVEGDWEL